MDQNTRICPWCSTDIPVGASACPKCGALVEGAVAVDLPGLTTVDPDARLLLPDEGLIPDAIDPAAMLDAGHDGTPASDPAFDPPTDEVRREMLKMELEAQIANAGTDVMNPTGDETITVGAPSDEAIAALDAGLLDPVGPGGENLEVLAAPWEDPELENRFKLWQSEDEEPK
jgi:hypothetical protein